MRIKLSYMTPLLAAGAMTAAIAAAPFAAAAPTAKSCAGAVCQSPGNVEIDDAPPPVNFYPYGDMPFLLGGGHR